MTIDNRCPPRCTPSAVFGPLEVEVVRDGLGGSVIVVRGELDRVAVPVLAGCVREVLDEGRSGGTVVLNLAETGFVDLGGMRLLTDVTEWATARDVRLYVAGCRASLLRLLHLSDLFDGIALLPPRPT
jgi:anti-anti-sigma factor